MVEMFMGYGTIKDGKLVSLQSGHFPQVMIGLDASKPTPAVGDYYIATDTGKNYTCYVNGTWALVTSPCFEEYQNHLGTTDNYLQTVVVGNGTATTNATLHRMDLSTGTALLSSASYGAHAADTFTIGNSSPEVNIKIQNIISGTGSTQFYTYLGLFGGSGGWALFIQNSNGTWKCETFDGISVLDTTITNLVAGDLITIKGTQNGTIFYYVNGSLVASHLLAGVAPVGGYLYCLVACDDANAAVARQISIDYVLIKVMK